MTAYIDIKKARLNGVFGFVVIVVLLALCLGLSLFLLSNPHKQLQRAVFETAERTHSYYRDRPGYWKLSTASAKDDNLLRADILKYKEYDAQLGQGADGAMSLPSDMSFDITLKNLNKSACISLSEMALKEQDKLILLKISIINDNGLTEFSWGGEQKLPVEKYSARKYCQPNNNSVMWTFQ